MKYIVRPIINHPYLTVILISVITVFFAYNLTNLKLNNDTYEIVPAGHPLISAQHDIEEDFGTAEIIIIGLKADDIFSTEFLEKVKKISKKLKKLKIESDPFVDPETGETKTRMKKCLADVKSLSTIPYIEGDEQGMTVRKLMKEVPKSPDEMEKLRQRIFSWDMYVGSIVSEDATCTIVAVEYKSSLSRNEITRMVDAVIKSVDETDFGKGVEVFLAGKPFIDSMVSTNVSRDMSFLLPAVFCVVIIFLLIAMRNVTYVAMIFVTIAISVTWTMGLMALFGQTVDLVSSAIPILLVAIGSAYSIHIINHYSDEISKGYDAATAVYNSINIVGISVFAASVTTMAGFMSLMTSSVGPIKKFGLFLGIGAGVDYSIHFLNGVKHGSRTAGPENSCREGLNITGNAIVFNALSVAFGFLVLLFSSFIPLIKLGIFVALTMVTACAGTLLLLPVIVNMFKPRCLQ
jgi:predicted RND superfamily exporter protein